MASGMGKMSRVRAPRVVRGRTAPKRLVAAPVQSTPSEAATALLLRIYSRIFGAGR